MSTPADMRSLTHSECPFSAARTMAGLASTWRERERERERERNSKYSSLQEITCYYPYNLHAFGLQHSSCCNLGDRTIYITIGYCGSILMFIYT